MTARDAEQSAAARPSLGDPAFARQPRDGGEPVFAEPTLECDAFVGETLQAREPELAAALQAD